MDLLVARARRNRRAVAAALLLALSTIGAASAANFRLSDGQSFSDVADVGGIIGPDNYLPVVSPDGRSAIYIHDAETDAAFELWRVPLAGGAPVRVSGLLTSGARTLSFRYTPDGQWILYRAAQDDIDAIELYSAPASAPAGSWTKLNDPVAPDSNVALLGVSPDSSSVAFAVAGNPDTRTFELWVAEVDGGSRQAVVSLPGDREIVWSEVAPDFSRFAYTADSAVDERFELWSVPTSGGAPVKLNGALVGDGDVTGLAVSPDGDRVVYLADQQANDVFELYTVPIAGGAPIKLNSALPPGSDVAMMGFLPGGQRILYAVLAEATGQFELWTVAPLGGDALRVHPPLGAGRDITFLALSPDGSRVVYVADAAQDDVFELWSVPATGGTPVRLNGTLTSGGDVAIDLRPTFTPDGTRVIYVADQLQDGRNELWSVPAGGGAALRLNRTFAAPAEWQVQGVSPSADSTRVAYVLRSRASGGAPWSDSLYSVSATAGPSIRLDDPFSVGGNVYRKLVVPPAGSRRVLYLADQDYDEQYELYVGDPCLFCDGFEAGTSERWVGP